MQERFSPAKHVPHYTRLLWQTLRTPAFGFFVVTGNFILLVATVLFFQCEHEVNEHVESWLDALWWGVSTITTVGYGDIVPVTAEGRIIGLLLMLSGVVFFIGSTALVVSVLTKPTSEQILETEQQVLSEHEQVLAEVAVLHRRLDELHRKLDGLGEIAASQAAPASETMVKDRS